MITILVKDQGYSLVKSVKENGENGEVIAYYPNDKLKELYSDFKKICLTSEFDEYETLDDFVNSIYFLEFFEYFLDDLHLSFPDVISYEKYKTNSESVIINDDYFKQIIYMCSQYVFNHIDINMLYTQLQNNINSINRSTLSLKLKKVLLRLYYGLLYFTKSVMNKSFGITDFLQTIKKAVVHNSKKLSINKSIILNSCSKEFIKECRKNLLSKFRLFQRKYLSKIAKLRKIGPPNATNKESLEIKKELNKNKNVDYKAYEVFCLYVLSKGENEDIYDYLAGIHKNSNGSIIHKNINNNKVANIKANTKKTHHKEYIEKSKEILKSVEDKIKEHGIIIDIKRKHQVERIRKLFDSEQFKNSSLSFGNENSPSIGGKIIQDCKRIRAINKEIDKIIKEHMKQENKDKQQKKREEVLKLIDELKETETVKNNANTREKIVHLLGYNLLRKTKNLSQKEINTINQMHNRLNEILPKSKS
jgi:hypothetical protein